MKLTEEEKAELAEKNFKFIHYLTKKYHTPQWDYEDLMGAATLGMTKALNTFDKEKGIKFSTYSARCITNAIFMFMRTEKRHLNNISIEQPLATDKDGQQLNIIDTIAAPEKELDWREISPIVNGVLSNLPARKRKVMEMFFENKTQNEISKAVGLSQTYVSRIVTKVLKQIKEKYWRGEKEVPNKTKLQITVEEFVALKYRDKLTLAKIAEIHGVAEATVHNWKTIRNEEIQAMVKSLNLVNEIKSHHDPVSELNKEIANLRSELGAKETYIDSRESLIERLEARMAALEPIETENHSLRLENEKLKQFITDQDSNMKHFQRLANENIELRQEIEALKFFARRYLAV